MNNRQQDIHWKLLAIALFVGLKICLAQTSNKLDEGNHHCFFRPGSVMGGLALPYSAELRTAGINGRVYYNINHNLCIGPEVAYFNTSQKSLWDIDLVMHYILETPWMGVYPVAGINYSKERYHGQERESATGLVVGAGAHRNFRRLTLFSEYTYVASKLRDQFVTIGFLYQIR